MKIDIVDGKPALDVVTTCIPRLLTVESISDFLSHIEDRHLFYLRWLVHLDQYKGLEENWKANLQQIEFMQHKFDDAIVLSSKVNRGHEGSLQQLFPMVKRDFLWIEDDHRWHHSFRLFDIVEAIQEQKADGFNFGRQTAYIGSMIPTYWTFELLQHLLTYWPKKFSEQFVQIELSKTNFRYAKIKSLPRKRISEEIGRQWMWDHGFKVNHDGIVLDPRYSKLSAQKKRWLRLKEKLEIDDTKEDIPKHTMYLLKVIEDTIGEPRRGCEVGVWKGETSRELLRRFNRLHLLLVDPYRPYIAGGVGELSKDLADPIKMKTALRIAEKNTEFAKDRRTFALEGSVAAAQSVPDGSLDFGFLDPDHFYPSVCSDLEAWYPKVRSGGLVCGHDYGGYWNRRGVWGVKRAVDEFAAKHGYKVSVSNRRFSLWWFVKR